MSSNNDQGGGAGGALVLAGVFSIFAAQIVYLFACFFAIILTILSLLALHRPLTLWTTTIHPIEARIFLVSGMIGAVAFPALVELYCYLYETSIPDRFWFYIVTGGYAFTSIGVTMHLAGQYPDCPPPHWLSEPVITPPPPVAALPRPEPKPFEYASWDDGDIRR